MIQIIKIGKVLLNVIYTFFKLLPVRKKVVMISRQSDQPSAEFELIRKEIEERDDRVKVVLLCKTLDGGVASTFGNKVSYAFHMFVQMYHIATARVVILDSYCIVASILNHRKSLTIIQMWHSMGTMKKFGYTALDTKEGSKRELAEAMQMHANYDYVFASAEAYKPHLAEGFQCDIEKIITMPLPRLDLLQSESYKAEMKSRIYERYPELKGKPVILYCPTFRKDETDFAKAVQNLSAAVDYTRYHFVVKLHPLSKVKLNDQIVCAEEFSTFDMLLVADYVISDYSCVVYEAAVLGLPLYFYNFDMDFYREGRGLAIDYEKELPGIQSSDAACVVNAIESGEYDWEKLQRFAVKYVNPTAHATADIVDFIWKFLK